MARPVKTFIRILTLLALASNLSAQEVHAAFAMRSYRTNRDSSTPRFWTPLTIALIATDGAAKAADSYATRKNLDNGGVEFNPLARPFVHTAGVQVGAMAAMLGAELAAAYFLHRKRHDNMGRAVLAGGALANALGAASSIKNRVGW
jgi:hypothetical protein